jgi:hypothetical protein
LSIVADAFADYQRQGVSRTKEYAKGTRNIRSEAQVDFDRRVDELY